MFVYRDELRVEYHEVAETRHMVYIVGHYSPDGKWVPESEHESRESAAIRCTFLNGELGAKQICERLDKINEYLELFYRYGSK